MIRILIIDDEPSAARMLQLLIEQQLSVPKVIASCLNPVEALQMIPAWKPTLLMLDIEMPGMNGFDLLNQLGGGPFDVIFTTAYDQYAIKAIRFSALDYLLKPIDIAELRNALHRHVIRQQTGEGLQSRQIENLLRNLQEPNQRLYQIALSSMDNTLFVPVETIIRCEAESNYTRFFFTDRRPVVVSKTLKEYEELLGDQGFVRVHKSHLVNEQFVREHRKEGLLILVDGTEVPLSRRRRDQWLRSRG